MAARIELRPHDGEPQQRGVAELRDDVFQNIEPAARDAINTWLDARGEARFRVGEHEFELQWTEPSFAAMCFGVELAFGPHRLLMALDGFTAANALLVADPFELMPAPLRDLVVQHVLARFIALLPASIADAADVRAVHWDHAALPDWNCVLGFTLRRLPEGQESQGIIATDSPASLLWLHEKLPTLPRSPTRANLPAPLSIVLGRTGVDLRALRDLEQGDVIWIETARPTREGLSAQLRTANGSHAWACRIRHQSLHILATQPHGLDVASADRKEVTMNTERSTLEIPVTFDLGELQVPVQELERMQPGRLFELPMDAVDATVSLRVAGRIIAEGTLVTVGKRIGVRIAQVLTDRQSHA